MRRLLELGEYAASKLAYPDLVVTIGNRLLDRQELVVREGATVSRNCRIRGRVTLEPHATLGPDCTLYGDIEVGRGTKLNENIEVIGEVSFGNYCALAPEIRFQQKNHEINKPAMQSQFYGRVLDSDLEYMPEDPITVGNDVWIGARAIVLPSVTIGDGAVIGAGSIVTDDVDPYAVVAGVPAERVKWRFSKSIREKLLEFKWWELSEDVLRDHASFFTNELTSLDDIPDMG